MAFSSYGKAIVFSTSDFYGNKVTLTEKTWKGHVAPKHVEMVGLENEVERALQDPDEILPSAQFPDVFGFTYYSAALGAYVLGTGTMPTFTVTAAGVPTNVAQMRVVVQYDDPNIALGNTVGKVNTAYPVTFGKNPNFGTAIYKKKK
jgi:hypothetical protein